MSTVIPAAPGFWFLEMYCFSPKQIDNAYAARTPIVAWRIEDDEKVAWPVTTDSVVEEPDDRHVHAIAIEAPDGTVLCDGEPFSTVAEFEESQVEWLRRRAKEREQSKPKTV